MSPAKKRSRSKKPPPNPTEFFEVACPRILTAMRSLVAGMGGRYAIVVEGDGGGTWTLDFVDAAVRAGGDGTDITITLDLDTFGQLASARGELRKLIADGSARCDKFDAEKVENLSMVLAFLQRG